MLREIDAGDIIEAVKELCLQSNYNLPEDVICALRNGVNSESSPTGRYVLNAILDNAELAAQESLPMCQDTGFAVFFVEIGQDVHINGMLLRDAINEGVRRGYEEGYFRKSICDPFTRQNTGDNTPAVVHCDIVEGDTIRICAAAKGGGSENMSRVTMLKPADGIEGIKQFVIQRASESGPNPCPPVVIGVGIGGTFEMSAILAKKALLRPLGTKNPDDELAELERKLFSEINSLGMGPMGMGGDVYALGVHIIKHPCHIASLPVAVNFNCHASRHKEIII